jgi:hypothetical protein
MKLYFSVSVTFSMIHPQLQGHVSLSGKRENPGFVWSKMLRFMGSNVVQSNCCHAEASFETSEITDKQQRRGNGEPWIRRREGTI